MAETEKNFLQQFIQVFKAIPMGKKISFAFTICVVVGGFITLLIWANRPDFQVLFANLDASDASRITEMLQEKKIPFELREGGSAVMVPDDMVYQLRLDMASEGIPRGQHVGFEIFENMPFGTTEFVQKLKYQRALQGELARTIMQFDAVAQARVHIVETGDSLFAEEERPATASVVLRLHPGQNLGQRQLQGIVTLVARAVKGLKPENVTLVDMAGGLLSKGSGTDSADALSRAQFEYQGKLERTLENRIQTMLESIIGLNRVVARVSAEVDFEQVNILEERYDPDSSVVRSEQRQTESSAAQNSRAAGSPDFQAQVYRNLAGSGGTAGNFRKENAVVNYEINKTNRQITNSVGDVKRLSVAVIIDGPYEAEKGTEGNAVQKFVPRSRREMKTFEDIIKKAIGFNEERGDQVNVSNIPFAFQTAETAFVERGVSWMDYAKKAAKPLFNVFLVLFFFMFAVKPFKKWLNRAGETLLIRQLPPGGEMQQLSEEAGGGSGKTQDETGALGVASNNPDIAAQVIKGWLSEGR